MDESDLLPIDPGMSPERMRITMLQIGGEEGWWDYESANPPGYVDSLGRRYDVDTYTLLIPPPEGSPEADSVRERVLLASEVVGYVLATADRHPGGVELIAHRPTLLPID